MFFFHTRWSSVKWLWQAPEKRIRLQDLSAVNKNKDLGGVYRPKANSNIDC